MIGMSKDGESPFMDHYVVMEPAKADEILSVGPTPTAPGDDVMGFDPISRIATVTGAGIAVAIEDRPLQGGRDDALSASVFHEPAVISSHRDLCDGIAEDRFQRIRPDFGARLEDDPGPGVSWCGLAGIDEHGDL
jgi:hypothetical protein